LKSTPFRRSSAVFWIFIELLEKANTPVTFIVVMTKLVRRRSIKIPETIFGFIFSPQTVKRNIMRGVI
jgi:hypothetical protein